MGSWSGASCVIHHLGKKICSHPSLLTVALSPTCLSRNSSTLMDGEQKEKEENTRRTNFKKQLRCGQVCGGIHLNRLRGERLGSRVVW